MHELADPATWPALGYRELPPGARWPEVADPALPAISVPDGEYDVVVVGAGAGGGVAACVLAEAGLRVLLVERGEALTREQLPLDHLRNSRVYAGVPRFLDGDEPRLVEDELVAPADPAWSGNAFTVGGGTRVYGAMAWRFVPEDFRLGETYGAPWPDWPIAYEDLEPYYDRVERELGVAGIEDNAARAVLARGAQKLGLTTQAVPLLIDPGKCVRCGTCVGFACHAGAKIGTHNTVIPRALATGRCDLLTGTLVTRVENDGVQAGAHRVRARHVVVAAGAIETARLLLASGLGNEHVGRNLQGHRYAGAVGIFDEVVQDCRGPGPSIATTQFRHPGPAGILANEFVPTPVEAHAKLGAVGLADDFAYAYPRAQFVVGPIQELPNPESRVELADGLVRLRGLPSPQDERPARFLAARAGEWLTASGAHTVRPVHFVPRKGPSGGQHQAGTCRLGAATDEYGRLHGHDGITIADASLHVTNGGVNPVLTVLALAWRNAERLAADLS